MTKEIFTKQQLEAAIIEYNLTELVNTLPPQNYIARRKKTVRSSIEDLYKDLMLTPYLKAIPKRPGACVRHCLLQATTIMKYPTLPGLASRLSIIRPTGDTFHMWVWDPVPTVSCPDSRQPGSGTFRISRHIWMHGTGATSLQSVKESPSRLTSSFSNI